MRRIFLHLGYPKTGTSSIQVFHRDNAEALAALGFYVPSLGRGRHGAHHVLTQVLAGQRVPPHPAVSEADIVRELAESPADSILISSEMLTGVLGNDKLARRLLGWLRSAGAEITLVMYVRNQTQSLNSTYSQQVKSFRWRRNFRDHVADALSRPVALSYDRWVEIADSYGVELRARPYSEDVRRDGVIENYLRTVGCPLSQSLTLPERVNESAGPFTVEAAVRLKNWTVNKFGALTLLQASTCKAALAEAVGRLGVEEPRYCGLDDALAREVETAFGERNDRFAKRMWGSDWRTVFGADVGQSFAPNDYRHTGVPRAMREPLRALMPAMRTEIKAILKRPRLAKREDWNRLPA